MSLENLTASLTHPQTFQISTHHYKPWAPLVFPDELEFKNEKPVPLSPSSSTVSSNQEEEDDIKSWPDEVFSPYSPATIYSSVEVSPARTSMNESPLTSLPESQPSQTIGLLTLSKIPKIKGKRTNKFTQEFYKRIEDYLDGLKLNFALPSDHKDSNIDKSSIRKLILGRTISENVFDNQETSVGTESSDVESPGLKSNIGTSALIMRRASLSHTSPTEVEAARQAMIVKKSIFHTMANEIYEENESPYMSKHSSALLAGQRSPIKLSAMLQECKWDDALPDTQSAAVSRTNSLGGNCLQIKSPAKISPLMRSGSFGRLPPINLFGSQIDFRPSTTKSALDLSTKHLKCCQDIGSTKKNIYGVSSFAEMLSNTSESSNCESPVSLKQSKDNEEC